MIRATILAFSFCFALPSITNCQTKKRERFYPSEYLYPNDQLGNGKTYIYQVDEQKEYRYMDVFPVSQENDTLYVTKHYNVTGTIDSAKFSSNWLMVDIYLFPGGIPIRGTIDSDEVIDDGSQLGRHLSSTVFKDTDFIVTVSSEAVYLKDTVFEWKGKMLDCIETQETSIAEFESNLDSNYKKIIKTTFTGYFAKGIGLVRYKGGMEDNPELMDLVEIKDIEETKIKK